MKKIFLFVFLMGVLGLQSCVPQYRVAYHSHPSATRYVPEKRKFLVWEEITNGNSPTLEGAYQYIYEDQNPPRDKVTYFYPNK